MGDIEHHYFYTGTPWLLPMFPSAAVLSNAYMNLFDSLINHLLGVCGGPGRDFSLMVPMLCSGRSTTLPFAGGALSSWDQRLHFRCLRNELETSKEDCKKELAAILVKHEHQFFYLLKFASTVCRAEKLAQRCKTRASEFELKVFLKYLL